MIKNLLVISLLIIFLFGCNSSHKFGGINAQINRVISGQTIEIFVDKKNVSFRLMGLRIPSNINYDKKLAQQHLIQLLTSNYHYPLNSVIVKVETKLNQKDKYGRLTGYVWLNNQLINRKVLEGGWAIASLEYTDGKYDRDLLQGEEYARIMGNGIWKINH
ncbi:thermonuclease family protein [Cyanobacterium aponinum UTEX 3222]|uniref:Nuclease (SNase domain-containing protein) n=2 Tax=Cyanobacterium aponinum TaxID=379064 RepID=K9Z8Z5_CYAAP|nr:thermonuclease family protein [Cyanobacterium aponinum]AFZ55075.1 nuclease (SNase domain-containing protein) [Cyanobacterium aponinum PCC 10605]MTF39223.1 hypothetical protein [Cyanobacterium aponinum 0216]WRL40049.1 thermonuclease family protein [Cyanobacterium aponinum UTEX 3221]WRL42938.1 thermonuclease family protein [Cyanobacterium aponinum UTEX 3222]